MSARAFVAFACIAFGLPGDVGALARHGVAQLLDLASVTWRRGKNSLYFRQ